MARYGSSPGTGWGRPQAAQSEIPRRNVHHREFPHRDATRCRPSLRRKLRRGGTAAPAARVARAIVDTAVERSRTRGRIAVAGRSGSSPASGMWARIQRNAYAESVVPGAGPAGETGPRRRATRWKAVIVPLWAKTHGPDRNGWVFAIETSPTVAARTCATTVREAISVAAEAKRRSA